MRTLASLIAVAFVSFMALGASAATVDILWQSNGTPTDSALPSDTVTASIFLDVTADGGSTGYGVSLQFNPAQLQVIGGDCVSPACAGTGGTTETLPAGFFFNLDTGVSAVNNGAGQVLTYEAAAFSAVNPGGPFLIGTVTFHVAGAGNAVVQSGLFNAGIDGILTPSFPTGGTPTTFNSAFLTIVPEPGTAALLGLGLMGLGFAGRRRS
jgi:hypothetical protein